MNDLCKSGSVRHAVTTVLTLRTTTPSALAVKVSVDPTLTSKPIQAEISN